MASSELAFTRSQLSQLPRDTLHELLKVQAGKPALKKNASKAHILDALFASAKRPKAPKFEAPKVQRKIAKLPRKAKRHARKAEAYSDLDSDSDDLPESDSELTFAGLSHGDRETPRESLARFRQKIRDHWAASRGDRRRDSATLSGDLARVPGVCLSMIFANLGFLEKNRLVPLCRAVRRCLQDPFAWTPLILKASDSEKLGTRIRERAEQEAKMMEADPLNIGLQDWWLTKTVTKCTEFDVELPRAPHAAYGDFLFSRCCDSDSDDDEHVRLDKRRKREAQKTRQRTAQARVEISLTFVLGDYNVDIGDDPRHSVKKFHFRGLQFSDIARIRESYAGFGHFHVQEDGLWGRDPLYTVRGEDREPAPLDMQAIARANTERAHAWQNPKWEIRPDPGLTAAEALLLRDFAVLVKVWVTDPETNARCARFEIRQDRWHGYEKRQARDMYGKVLQKLRAKYPAWAAVPDRLALSVSPHKGVSPHK